jgi:hypothetical protein
MRIGIEMYQITIIFHFKKYVSSTTPTRTRMVDKRKAAICGLDFAIGRLHGHLQDLIEACTRRGHLALVSGFEFFGLVFLVFFFLFVFSGRAFFTPGMVFASLFQRWPMYTHNICFVSNCLF